MKEEDLLGSGGGLDEEGVDETVVIGGLFGSGGAVDSILLVCVTWYKMIDMDIETSIQSLQCPYTQ
jgi:hypothetical protein